MNYLKPILLQIPDITDSGKTILDAAQNVQNGDGSGYTFAVTILSFVLLMAVAAIIALYRGNQKSRDKYMQLAEKSILAFSEVNIKLNNQDRLEQKVENLKDYVTGALSELKNDIRRISNH